MKNLLIAIAAASVAISATPVLAIDAPAAAAPKAALSTAETDLGTLLDNPAAKAVLQKYIEAMISNPQIEMARSMTLKQLQGYAGDTLTDETLAKIDADLAAIK